MYLESTDYEEDSSLIKDTSSHYVGCLCSVCMHVNSNFNCVCLMIPERILELIEGTKEDAKKAAYAWFNKCDLQDLIDTKLCLVDMDRVESFLDYAKSKGVVPNGGAITENMKAQYFYV